VRSTFIAAKRAEHSVSMLCRCLWVTRSGFYAWRRRPESTHTRLDRRLRVLVQASFAASHQRYGSPRIHEDLREQHEHVSRKRVVRLMQEGGLVARARKRFKCTTMSDHDQPVAANLLDQQFEPAAVNQRWVGDTTEFVIGDSGKLYLAAILDLCSRFVVGWALSAVNDRHLTLKALELALKRRYPEIGLLHHSDQGCIYASEDYQAALDARGIVCSMSGRGNCYDNAVMESFFSSLKLELGERFDRHGIAKMQLFDYIEVFYNQRRRHSTLWQISPAAYEHRLVADAVDAAGAMEAQTRPPLSGNLADPVSHRAYPQLRISADIRSGMLCGAPRDGPRRRRILRRSAQHKVLGLQVLKPGEDVGLVARHGRASVDGSRRRLQGPTFHLEVSLYVHFERLEVRVAQDVFDGDRVNASLPHVHGLCVSEGVRRDRLARQRRVADGGEAVVVLKHKGRTGSGQGLPARVPEERRGIRGGPAGFLDVMFPERRGRRQEWHDSHLPPFARDPHQGQPIQAEVRWADREHFLNAAAGIVEQRQQEIVASTFERRSVRLREDRFDFVPRQIADQMAGGLLERDVQDTLRDRGRDGLLTDDIREEGPDGGQPRVACPHGVAAMLFEIFKEV
jgi:putative transposase